MVSELDWMTVGVRMTRAEARAVLSALAELRTIVGGRLEHGQGTPAQQAAMTAAISGLGKLAAAVTALPLVTPDTRYPLRGHEGVGVAHRVQHLAEDR